VRFFRRKRPLRTIGESEAYVHSYGERTTDVRVIKLPPRRPRYGAVLLTGEKLRRAFAERLDARDSDTSGRRTKT
jgi:hypothetical protein